ncbi:MAG: hypothetical protein ACK4R3_12835, partial [Aliihoeflea sp.]
MPANHSCALVDRPLRFVDSEPVLAILRRVTRGWSWTAVSDACKPFLEVRQTGAGFMIDEPGRRRFSEPSAVSAACSLVVILLNRMVETDPSMLCLHAGAVSIAGRNFIFPSSHRAGKSTLAAALAFDGAQILADDIVPVDCGGDQLGAIVASGVRPRLRLPLPRALGRRFAFQAWRHKGPDDGHYRYLTLPPARLAPFGERREADAVVCLERARGVRSELLAVAPDQAMKVLLVQNFGNAALSDIVLRRMNRLASHCPAFLLRYETLADARELLAHLAARDVATTQSELRHGTPRVSSHDSAQTPSSLPAGRIVRAEDVVLQPMGDGGAFLADRLGGGIFALDALGAAIWEALAAPVAPLDLADELAEAYPDVA